MIINTCIKQTIVEVIIRASAILGVSLIIPGGNVAASESGDQITSNQRVQHNRLIDESSPYLLQHAANPTDWFPRGSEAFDKARREDKPVFLSIGYSTCHRCHVMEHESFSDPEELPI